MSEQDQWRFQWPDGTWIRWNPLTQSWEKESADDPQGAGAPPKTAVRGEDRAVVEVEETAADADVVPDEPPASEADVVPSGPPASEFVPETSSPRNGSAADEIPSLPERRTKPSTGRVRPMVDDVVSEEETAPRGSLWPTMIVGAIAGVGIGLVVLEVMR